MKESIEKNKVIASEITKKPNECKRKLEELVPPKREHKQAIKDLSDDGADDFEDKLPYKKHSKKEVQAKEDLGKRKSPLEKGKELS